MSQVIRMKKDGKILVPLGLMKASAEDISCDSNQSNVQTELNLIRGSVDYAISTSWVANTDIGDYETYPFKQTVSNTVYTTDRDCLILGANASAMPTKEEMNEFAKICQFVDFSNGVTVLANAETTVALTLRVKGV